MKYLLILVFPVLLHCSTALINDKQGSNTSTVTAYVAIPGLVLDSVTVKNTISGSIHTNMRRGWGSEFFPEEKRGAYIAIANITPGRYCISSIQGWYLPGNKKTIIRLKIPDDIFQFMVESNDILYLGDMILRLYPKNIPLERLHNNARLYQEKGYTTKIFTTENPYNNSEESYVMYINGVEPGKKGRLRPGEDFFLKFIISKSSRLSGWAKIASGKLNEDSEFLKYTILKELAD